MQHCLQVGDQVPDVSAPALEGAWEATQSLLRQRLISAGHDVGDGGVAVTLLEMAFAGNCGLQVRALCTPSLPQKEDNAGRSQLFCRDISVRGHPHVSPSDASEMPILTCCH